MVRKSSIIVVTLGCVLLALAAVEATTPRVAGVLKFGFPYLAQIGVVLLWWPIFRRREVPSGDSIRKLAAVARVVLIILMLVLVLTYTGPAVLGLVFPPQKVAIGKRLVLLLLLPLSLVTPGVQCAAAICFFRKPRLMLSWIAGILTLLALVILAVVVLALMDPKGAGMALWIGLGYGTMMWPVFGPLLGLGIAWIWVRSAEKKHAAKGCPAI